jgi:uroporphyrin-III C-methyltransferase
MSTLEGKVFLVGAGPGDPELLTLKAVRALAAADLVLCDALVSEAILAHAKPGARIVHVGKRGGCKSTPQPFIERLMIAAARAGQAVVRLKGGDPLVFGRGAEECDALRTAGVAFEVINGITSGLAAANALGISLTHRALCHGAVLVTGHEHEGAFVDWAALARTGLPLVIYMGVARSAKIQGALLAAGMRGSMPAAAVSNASRRDERAIVTCLERLAPDMSAHGIESPAIVIVGEVARFAIAAPSPRAYLAANTFSRISATARRAASAATGSAPVCGSLSTHRSR